MEHIKKAIERAKQERINLAPHAPAFAPTIRADAATYGGQDRPTTGVAAAEPLQTVALDRQHLQAMRIVAYESSAEHATSYDMLRTQVLQRMAQASVRTLAVTSPRLGCGKTVTAINLALSIARQSEQNVVLVDLDLRKPQIARYLGLQPVAGTYEVVSGRCRPSQALLVPDVCGHRLAILATPGPVANPTEHIVSTAMRNMLAGLKAESGRHTIIFDLPPMLSSDDFLAFMPQVDCALLVAASGESTIHDIAECERLIEPDKFLGCVLNKVTEAETVYPYYA